MKLNELQPLTDLSSFYADELIRYKTPSTKKARMSRDIKKHEEWVADVKAAVGRADGTGLGWLHGERFGVRHLIHYQNELNLMLRIKSSIV